SFKNKKIEYQKSLIKPNSELVKYDEWTPKQIEDRQKELADTALKIWN
ncbi:GmrSD restriction endonuclease domain-containing protein, partial [Mitsuokella multacida]